MRPPYQLGSLPTGRRMVTTDQQLVHAAIRPMFDIARRVEDWPKHLPHYRHVRFQESTTDGGGLVEMSADRPFGPLRWPTWWLSEMEVDHATPAIRFRHVDGITSGMEVEWSFTPTDGGTLVRILHVWDGPAWPLIGAFSATTVIGPVFIHGIASRTLAGLARVAERQGTVPRVPRR
jgi:ribosome-associated toxin RatA of RatAB toxin-antitoxin module